MSENFGNAITRLQIDQFGRNLDGRIQSSPRHVRRHAVAMATPVAWQLNIEHLAVMGVWKQKTWTNFDETWYATANLESNDSYVTKYEFIFKFKMASCGKNHPIFMKFGRLEAGSVNRFRWNLSDQISLRRRFACVGGCMATPVA